MNIIDNSVPQSGQDRTGSQPWLTVIGVGENGDEGLNAQARRAIEEADLIIGGARHLELIDTKGKPTKTWGKRLRELVKEIGQLRGQQVCVLASGDPLFYGVGSYFAEVLDHSELTIIPQISIMAQVCTRLFWRESDVNIVTLCGRPLAMMNSALFDGARLIILCAGKNNAVEVAKRMCERGFGQSRMHIFDYVGGPREQYRTCVANDITEDLTLSDLNTLAVECVAAPDAEIYAPVPGLADEFYENDGQLTKSEVRAIALSRLSPRPGELLWDIGGGAGSIAIEWMRAAPETTAISIERRSDRADRIKRNAAKLGVPRLDVRVGDAVAMVPELPTPNAIFIGGGLTSPGLIDTCWQLLKPGGRLVANTVTLESEALLLRTFQEKGGDLIKIAVNRADPVGPYHGWRPAMPVTQLALVKPYTESPLE